tara:strand:+ start:321 stop:605 length:285 start_codon:yes stop_codon:yes gene_type:complete
MIYLRYEFNDKAQAESKIDAFYNEDGELTIDAAFIRLDKFVMTEGTYDEDGVELTAPVFSEGYALDVLWRDLNASPYGWKSYEVEPSNPKHKLL